jgi:hypothetical protein
MEDTVLEETATSETSANGALPDGPRGEQNAADETGDEPSSPNPTYFHKSGWLGERSPGREVRFGGDGRPVIGIHGSCEDCVHSLGLILAR